jgi:hypothetical protein
VNAPRLAENRRRTRSFLSICGRSLPVREGETCLVDRDADTCVDDFRWFAENFDLARKSLSFVFTDQQTLAAQPFLDYRWKTDRLAHREVSLDAAVARFAPGEPPPHLNFIWHTSFCCSTLIAKALDLPGHNLSLCEPQILVPIADLKRAGMFAGNRLSPRLPEIVFRLLARMPDRDTRVTVKPSNFTNILIADAARATRGKALFLYSDLESFLISVAKSGIPLLKYARRLFSCIVGDSGRPLPWKPHEIFQMSDLEIAALVWHMQIGEFRRDWPLLEAGRSASLDCEAFLADPAAALAKLDSFFGLGLGADHIKRVLSGPLLRSHAKAPGHPYDARQRAEEKAAARQRLGADLERVIAWSYKACSGTPQGVPLSNPI